MVVVSAHVFPGFLTPVLILLFFPKSPTTFLTCFCRSEKQKYTVKKVCINRGSNLQPTGHESDMLTTEPPDGAKFKRPVDNTELENINITEIYMKKQYKSSITKNNKIKEKYIFDGVSLKGYVAS